MSLRTKCSIVLIALITFTGGPPSASAAVDGITDCNSGIDPDANCDGNDCELSNDIECDTGEKILLQNGKDLDLNGFDITCAASVDCGPAVLMESSGSKVVDNAGGGKISGDFDVGVDCDGVANTTVEGIRIEISESGSDGIRSCRKVIANYVEYTGSSGSGGVGIAALDASNSLVQSNTVEGAWGTALRHAIISSSGVTTEHNLLLLEDDTAKNNQVGLSIGGTKGTVSDNLVFGALGSTGDLLISAPTSGGPTRSRNICEWSLDECQDCIFTTGTCDYPSPSTP